MPTPLSNPTALLSIKHLFWFVIEKDAHVETSRHFRNSRYSQKADCCIECLGMMAVAEAMLELELELADWD